MAKTLHSQIHRVIDANFNRAKEGLRVCEDICRFVYDDASLTKSFKNARHALSAILLKIDSSSFIRARNIQEDVGKLSTRRELTRQNVRDVIFANIQRVKESIRVLEEFTKLLNQKAAVDLKSLRYKIYALEQKIAIDLLSANQNVKSLNSVIDGIERFNIGKEKVNNRAIPGAIICQ